MAMRKWLVRSMHMPRVAGDYSSPRAARRGIGAGAAAEGRRGRSVQRLRIGELDVDDRAPLDDDEARRTVRSVRAVVEPVDPDERHPSRSTRGSSWRAPPSHRGAARRPPRRSCARPGSRLRGLASFLATARSLPRSGPPRSALRARVHEPFPARVFRAGRSPRDSAARNRPATAPADARDQRFVHASASASPAPSPHAVEPFTADARGAPVHVHRPPPGPEYRRGPRCASRRSPAPAPSGWAGSREGERRRSTAGRPAG